MYEFFTFLLIYAIMLGLWVLGQLLIEVWSGES